MQPSESTGVGYTEDREHEGAQPGGQARPIGVTLIAGIQLLKSAGLLLTVALLQLRPEMVNGPDSPVYPLLYVATRGQYDAMDALQGGTAQTALILLLGLYLGAIGVGMLYVNAWARRTLILSSGLTLLLFAKSSLWPDSAPALDMTNIYMLLAVDAWVLVYLLRGNTAEVFESWRYRR